MNNNNINPPKYSLEDKLAGRDLYGLTCRIPEPTPAQAKCSHSKWKTIDNGFEDFDGAWHTNYEHVEVETYEDIPGTNNFRCTQCGYTRRY